MVYDSANNRVILFGGGLIGEDHYYLHFNETWAYSIEENAWRLLEIDKAPSPRSAHVMAYDPIRQQIILYGGLTTDKSRLSDTWVFDCTDDEWTKISPEGDPRGRSDAAMIYDAANSVFVLYGGWGATNGLLDDTWIHNPEAELWAEVETDVTPGRMYGHDMTYDPVNARAILYGGHIGSPTSRLSGNGVWIFDSSNEAWIEEEVGERPPGRHYHSASYSSGAGRLVVFGGTPGGRLVNETWLFDFGDSTWIQLDMDKMPSGRGLHDAVYIPEEDIILLFGGVDREFNHFNDTWVLSIGDGSWEELDSRVTRATEIDAEGTGSNGIPGFPYLSIAFGLIIGLLIRDRFHL